MMRRWLPLIVGAVMLVVATLVTVVWTQHPFGPIGGQVDGTSLDNQPAPDFHLTDADGRVVSMDQMRGKAVALTFIYTSCPDVCPIITSNFKQAADQLGADTSHVSLMAITVDPETDTPGRIAQYSQAMGIQGQWEFLTGTRDQLAPVWAAYWVAPIPLTQAQELATLGPSTVQSDPNFQALHTAPVFVIDRQGRERWLLDPSVSAGEIASALRAAL
jgi:protein SCO1